MCCSTACGDPLGNTSSFAYDPVGPRTSQVTPNGNAAGADPASFRTTYDHDPLGHVIRITDPLGGTIERSFDGNRNLVSMRDPDGRTTSLIYDSDDRMTEMRRPDASVLRYAYDSNGNVVRQIDGAGATTAYSYDPLDRLVSITDPLSRTTGIGYDATGNRASVTGAEGQLTSFGYDAADQLVTITYSDGSTPKVTFAYDEVRRRRTMVDGNGTSRYDYDALGRLVSSVTGTGTAVGYEYDLADRLVAIIHPGGRRVSRVLDSAGRLTAVSDWLGNTTSFAYDADGNLTRRQYPNGTTAELAFDRADRVVGSNHATAAGNVAGFAYGRTAGGLVATTTTTGLGADESYDYTPLAQLAAVNSAMYGYDKADNLIRLASGASLGYDDAGQLTSMTAGASTTTFGFDRRGNRVRAGSTEYVYDQANRLLEVAARPTSAPGLVAGGAYHSLAASDDGATWAWGSNVYGQLGDGTTTSRPAPVRVLRLPASVAVTAGSFHSMALAADGRSRGSRLLPCPLRPRQPGSP